MYSLSDKSLIARAQMSSKQIYAKIAQSMPIDANNILDSRTGSILAVDKPKLHQNLLRFSVLISP